MDDKYSKKVLDFPKENISKTSNKKGKYILSLLAIIVIIVFCLIGTDTTFHATNAVKTDIIPLSNANNYEFASYKEGYISAKDGKISCYNTNQELQWEMNGSKTTPTIKVNGDYVLVYYNEDKLAVVTDGNKTKKIKTSGNVLFGNVNKHGYTVLFLNESGLKNKITVYNNKGEMLYYRDNPDNFVTYALLSDDNYSLITNELVTDKNNVSSVLNVTNIRKNEEISVIEFNNSIPVSLQMVGKKKIIAVFESKMHCYSISSGKKRWETSFAGLRLYKTSFDNDLFGFVFNKNDSSDSGSHIAFYNTSGKKVGEYISDSKVHYLDIKDKNALLTMDRHVQMINIKGKQISSADITYDIKKVIFIANKQCALILTNSREAKLLPLD